MTPSGVERDIDHLQREVTQLKVDVASIKALHESRQIQYQRDLQRHEDEMREMSDKCNDGVRKLQEAYDELRDKKNQVIGWLGAAVLLIQALPLVLKFIGWLK